MSCLSSCLSPVAFFFFNATATPEIYTLSLHDALPISAETVRTAAVRMVRRLRHQAVRAANRPALFKADRKSTRLNSSHMSISYAVFCLKKKKKTQIHTTDNEHTPTGHLRRVVHRFLTA